METNETKLAWTEICYLLSESIKQEINEKDFENQVLRTQVSHPLMRACDI
jgi:hypothetical protein